MIASNTKLIDLTRLTEFLAKCKLLFAAKSEVYTKAETKGLVDSVKDSMSVNLETGCLEVTVED